jgi:hypothetical protein
MMPATHNPNAWARLDIAAFYARTYREQLAGVLAGMKPNVYGICPDDEPRFSGSQMVYARAEARRRAVVVVNQSSEVASA